MFESHRDVQLEPGSWSLWKAGRKALIFCCPVCKEPKILKQDVLRGGRVSGTVRCVKSGCSFRDDLRLLGWPEGEEYP